MKSRHEPVPQSEGQSASRPECIVTHPSPDCFSRPRASRSSSRGRGVGLVFLWGAPSFSSLFFRFSVLVSRELSRSRGCAVATSAIRGVSRCGCAASPCSGEVPPDSRGQWHPEHRAPTQEPRIFSGIPSVRTSLVRFWPYLPMFWFLGSLHFPAVTSAIPGLNSDLDVRFPPAVTSASEVLTQTYRSSGLVRCWAQYPKVREEQCYMSA